MDYSSDLCEWMKQKLREQHERRKRGESPGYAHCSCCHTGISSFGLINKEADEATKRRGEGPELSADGS